MTMTIKRAMGAALLLASVLAGPVLAAPDSVNINNADAATLAEVLNGVGLTKAQAIVEYREQHGAFRDAYELANIKGIGERTVEKNEARIRLQD
jgi:competence protein ComEA